MRDLKTLDKMLKQAREAPNIDLFDDIFSLLIAWKEPNTEYDTNKNKSIWIRNKKFRSALDKAIRSRRVSNLRRMEYLQLLKRSYCLEAPESFRCFLIAMEWNREPEKRFYIPRRKTLDTLVDDLQDLADDKIEFLGISLPPRVGKSTTCMFYMAWIAGRSPEEANVLSGHSDTLTQTFFDELLSLMTSTEYCYADIFPKTKIEKSAKYTTINLGVSPRFKTITCRSASGTLTGAVEISEHGMLYCDDLVKDQMEAANELRLQNVFSDYENQLKDRKKDGARELMVGTRWNVFDPLGRLMNIYEDDPRYRFRVIPALDDNDESNFNYEHNVGFSSQYYRKLREEMISGGEEALWWAKFMGQPYIREGLLYRPNEIRRYFDLPEGEPDAILAVCDTKDKGPDYCSMPIVYVYGQDCYLHDVVYDSSLPEVVEPRLAMKLAEHKVKMARFESNLAGSRIARDVEREQKKLGGICSVSTKYTTSNKETKIIVNSSWVKSHVLFLDDSRLKGNIDYIKFMKDLCLYTMAGKNAHDDAPDSLAMLSEFVQSLITPRIEAFSRPF